MARQVTIDAVITQIYGGTSQIQRVVVPGSC
jgi:alkylation response protein AidB-like acyl-CoA dehydrogenase